MKPSSSPNSVLLCCISGDNSGSKGLKIPYRDNPTLWSVVHGDLYLMLSIHAMFVCLIICLLVQLEHLQ